MTWVIRIVVVLVLATRIQGADLDSIGVSTLRELVPDLDGSGVVVAQPEAGSPTWQVNPQTVNHPQTLFRWISADGTSTQFPNGLGSESGHADAVGNLFYGAVEGVAPDAARVDNYEAGHFFSLINAGQTVGAAVINQSFMFAGQLATVDQAYDDHAVQFGTVFVSGAGNGGQPSSPATCFNGLSVGAFNGQSTFGPTLDGRCKPDVVAPAGQTSFSTPLVAGVATLLLEAVSNGVGGASLRTEAGDFRTLKALLLNGAEKPPGWTNGSASPLDARFGAGVVNALRSYLQLRGGKHAPGSTNSYALGDPHLPPAGTGSILSRRGWNLATLSSSATQDRAQHYYFDLTNASGVPFTLDATLVWARGQGKAAINDLDLTLYSMSNTAVVASSQSAVDNVEHLHIDGLPPGRYALQVLKFGGLVKRVSNAETYSLAFDIGPRLVSRLGVVSVAGNTFQGQLTGEPFEHYVIQRSANLQTWIPRLTNNLPAAGWQPFSDTLPANSRNLFYRAILAP